MPMPSLSCRCFVLINVIELLCTAGLPALFTQILALQHVPLWKDYSYLALHTQPTWRTTR
jgi:hypothetical protein